jgi:hypothetical protein
MERRKFYERFEDMSPDGKLQLFMEDDGDVIVTVFPPQPSSLHAHPPKEPVSVQFCTCGSGGGQSSRTRDALVALADAIEADNAERQQHRS